MTNLENYDYRNNNCGIKISIAAENTNESSFAQGEEVRLACADGKYILIRENGDQVRADICMNTTPSQALHLALAQACFTVKKTFNNIVKAEMKSPYSLVHHGVNQWLYLN